VATEPEQNRPPEEVLEKIRKAVDRAKAGDAAAVPELRAYLDAHPDLWKHCGDLAAHAEAAWAGLAAGPDLHLRECLLRKAAEMRAELAGPAAPPAEKLLAARVVATWLQLAYFDAAAAQAGARPDPAGPKEVAFRVRRHAQAQKAHLDALVALITLRKLLTSPRPVRAAAPAPSARRKSSKARPQAGRGRRAGPDPRPNGGPGRSPCPGDRRVRMTARVGPSR
jgi:hypothetical protein